ncbi:MAG: DUF1611 domain-containing protein [Pirellulales bacterium]|nr:DUF1611 domain-containing protein [Pirellulales bacterium]
MNTPRKMIIVTDGFHDLHTAKTAICVLRYRPAEVVAVLDREAAGQTCQELFRVGGDIPIVAALTEAPGANALLIGIAPPGGKIPPHWRPFLLEAIGRGMTLISGLHDLLKNDAEFVRAAAASGAKLVDLRENDEHDVNDRRGIRAECLRIHTIGTDCSVGKMVAAVEVADGLCRDGIDAQFVATGQTGIIVAGSGCPIDRVIADFVAGAAEKLVRANQHHEVIVVEGQGSLFHPRYSGVTLSLLHGLMPDGLILGYEMGRRVISDVNDFPLPTLEKAVEVYETMANIMNPCRVIGVFVNGQHFPHDDEVAAECERIEKRLGLPTCDVIRHGPGKLVEAVRKMKRERGL